MTAYGTYVLPVRQYIKNYGNWKLFLLFWYMEYAKS